jgi:hypothetical protein
MREVPRMVARTVSREAEIDEGFPLSDTSGLQKDSREMLVTDLRARCGEMVEVEIVGYY